MTTTKRISLTIDVDVLSDLDYISNKLNVTRSSLMSEMLRKTASEVRSVTQFLFPEVAADEDAAIARSPEKVREFLESLVASELDTIENELRTMAEGKH